MKAKQKKQKAPALQKTSIQYRKDVFVKLQNMSGITGRHDYELVDQALRKFFGMATPTIEDEIKGAK